MKKLLAITAALSLFIIPFSLYSAESGLQGSTPPPVSQPLVAEGDFAFELVTTLKLGTPATEAQAEDILTSVGIAPKNGWIANYPMTPIIVGQVQDALVGAAESKKLPMGKEEALRAFRTAIVEAGIPIVAEVPGNYPETQPEYVEPSAIDNYYSSEGPPVVTYYPPPPDYSYLYAWVPYPFLWTGFFFPGFFVLNDFDTVVVGHFGHHFHHNHDFDHHGHDFDHRITNHFRDPKTHDFRTVDPATRTAGIGASTAATRMAALRSPDARRGATSILNRSAQPSRPISQSGTAGRSFARATPRTANGRTLRQPGNMGRTYTGSGRSFSAPASRSFGVPSQSFAKTFSPPGRSFSEPPVSSRSSFGGMHGGSFGGFHGGVGGFHR